MVLNALKKNDQAVRHPGPVGQMGLQTEPERALRRNQYTYLDISNIVYIKLIINRPDDFLRNLLLFGTAMCLCSFVLAMGRYSTWHDWFGLRLLVLVTLRFFLKFTKITDIPRKAAMPEIQTLSNFPPS